MQRVRKRTVFAPGVRERNNATRRKGITDVPGMGTKELARPDGFEPPTTWFEAKCSIQLSYGRLLGHHSSKFKANGKSN